MATILNYNIKQVTNHDLRNTPTVTHLVKVARRENDGTIKIVPINKKYKTAVTGVSIAKLGYCCEQRGIDFPIFLQINGSWEEIQIGKEGMYEMQPETYLDENSDDGYKTSTVRVTAVQVPDDIRFTLDYAMLIN